MLFECIYSLYLLYLNICIWFSYSSLSNLSSLTVPSSYVQRLFLFYPFQLHFPWQYSLGPILCHASILDYPPALPSSPHFVTPALCLPSTPGPTQTASIWIWCWRDFLNACKLTSVCISTDSFLNPVQPLKVPVPDVYGRFFKGCG